MKTKGTILFFICMIFLFGNCIYKKHVSNDSFADRKVFVVSGGFNAAYGCIAIELDKQGAHIDTSYYPKDNLFTFMIDSVYREKNSVFSEDLKKPIESKKIYSTLFKMKMDSLKLFEKESQKQKEGFSMQPVRFIEGKDTVNLMFYIPKDPIEDGNACDKFLFNLKTLFPYNGYYNGYCKQFYY